MLSKGLNFSLTPTTSSHDSHNLILHSFNEFARSLRLKYKRAHCTRQRQHHKAINPTTTSKVYRSMKFLPPPKIESPQERYTGIAHLEKYIDDTKDKIAKELPTICSYTTSNLSQQQYTALTQLKHRTIIIKPADKNLGIVLMNTNDYIHQCMTLLSDTTTYRSASVYPITEIERNLSQILISFKNLLQSRNKRLYNYLSNRPTNIQTPQFYGIPKIHKKYVRLPPMRPIVSQTGSRLTPSAKLIDHMLQPLAQSYPDYLHNSTSLVLMLQDLHVPDDAILVTIDVTSLYPSIPQSECLATIYQEMYKHTSSGP